jgi:MtN3 and saliva related transmembrane protein
MPQLDVTVIGHAAGVLTTLSFLPQVIKAWRTGSTGDLSLIMLLTFLTGIGLWLAYGLAIGALPLILANAVTLALVVVLLALKLGFLR